ncbi:MAG: winged helix-turn-helix domain-containing protein [Candidatus Micrarchaeales archaeon]
MSKTLETKKKILNILNKKEMTTRDLSRELNLSAATVSEHLDDLQRMGAVEKIDNEHFKKLKYYKTKENMSPIIAKYVIGAVAIIAIISVFYFYQSGLQRPNPITANNLGNASKNTSGSTLGSPAGAFSCIMLFYQLNGSVTGYSGFSAYQLNYSNQSIEDYVVPAGSSGILHIKETVYNVLSEPSNSSMLDRQHYAHLAKEGNSLNNTGQGLNVTIDPLNFTIKPNETVTFNVTVNTNATATPNTTYVLRIDGPCGGGVDPVLLTVGNRPYNGTVSLGVVNYA